MKLTKNRPTFRVNEKEEQTMSEDEKELLIHDRKGKREKHGERSSKREMIFDKIADFYFNTLKRLIATRKSRLILIFMPIFLLLMSFSFGNGFELFPQSDNKQINITLESKEGRKTESMYQYVPLLQSSLQGLAELNIYNITVNNNALNVTLELFDKDYRAANGLRDSFAVEKDINTRLDIFRSEGLRVESGVLAGGPPGGKAVGIKLIADTTDDLATLTQVAADFEAKLKTIKGTKNVTTSSTSTPGQFVFKLDYNKIAALGLTPSEITGAIFASTNGLTAGTIK